MNTRPAAALLENAHEVLADGSVYTFTGNKATVGWTVSSSIYRVAGQWRTANGTRYLASPK
jgi:hypothetical protein